MKALRGNKGFTLIEVIIVLAILGILLAVVSGGLVNTRGATEARAYEGMSKFLADNSNIQVERKTCAGDSDGDGYGTCTIVTTKGETIRLECPTGYFDRMTGAESCKDMTGVAVIQGRGGYRQ